MSNFYCAMGSCRVMKDTEYGFLNSVSNMMQTKLEKRNSLLKVRTIINGFNAKLGRRITSCDSDNFDMWDAWSNNVHMDEEVLVSCNPDVQTTGLHNHVFFIQAMRSCFQYVFVFCFLNGNKNH